MKAIGAIVAMAVAVLGAVGVAADDKWEIGGDDAPGTVNQLTDGAVQTHDVEGPFIDIIPSDQDFSFVAAKARHSYEVRVFNANFSFFPGGIARLDRVASDGTSIVAAAIAPDGVNAASGSPGWVALRWIESANQFQLIRVNGVSLPGLGGTISADFQYDIQMRDTTYLVPRWNNSGTQITVFLIQNGSTSPISGSIFFYSAAGALLHTQPLSLAANGLQVLSTAGIAALAGTSGSAAIAHDGGYGALAGKAVALEPATGFTFDTVIAAIPY